MTRHDDGDEIARGLTDNIERLLDTYVGGYETSRGKAYLTAKGPKQLGSFHVNLTGPKRGSWYRFSVGFGGGPVSLLAYLLNGMSREPTTGDNRTAFEEARKFLGMDTRPVEGTTATHTQRKARDARERSRAEAEAKAQADLEARQDNAWSLWEHGQPLAGTPGEIYLRKRGIRLDTWPESLRFASRIKHGLSCRWGMSILCRVDGAAGEFLGLWRIYVTDNGDKAFGDQSKLGLGPTGGGAVRLFPPVHGAIGLAEGVETALSVYVLTKGAVAPWAALSTSGMVGFDVPFEVDRVKIFPDADLARRKIASRRVHPSPGLTAAETLRTRLVGEGISCTIDQSRPRRGRDLNDVLRTRHRIEARP